MTDRKVQPAEAVTYLQVRLDHKRTTFASEASVVRSTQTKPSKPLTGCIVVKIKLRIPAEGWDPFEPSAVVEIPAGLIQHPIEVVADDAQEDA